MSCNNDQESRVLNNENAYQQGEKGEYIDER